MIRWLIVFSFLTACSHAPKVPDSDSDLAYPFGTYEHNVKITIPSANKRLAVRGVVESSSSTFKIVGLTDFATTAFRIEENLKTGAIKKEFFIDSISKNESQFMSLYSLIKALMWMKKTENGTTMHGAKFLLSEPDAHGIFRKIDIIHPRIQLKIEVSRYVL